MTSAAIYSFAVATILGLLQLGAGNKAPPYMQNSYPQPGISSYNTQQYAMPQYATKQYATQQYYPQQYYPQQVPTKQYNPQQTFPPYSYNTSPQLSGEFEGLYTENDIVGSKNTDFTGFDILSDVELPVNVLSLTDILG